MGRPLAFFDRLRSLLGAEHYALVAPGSLTYADRDKLKDLLRFQQQPRLWIPSEQYAAFVSFLVDLDVASGGQLLDGFGRWLASGKPTGMLRWGHIERNITGREDGAPGESHTLSRLSPEVSAKCVRALFDALDQFLSQEGS